MKYVTIHVVGHCPIKAFENEKKETSRHPDYKGDGVAVWVNEAIKKEKPEKKGAS